MLFSFENCPASGGVCRLFPKHQKAPPTFSSAHCLVFNLRAFTLHLTTSGKTGFSFKILSPVCFAFALPFIAGAYAPDRAGLSLG